MSFWKGVKKAMQSVGDFMDDTNSDVEDMVRELIRKSDKELVEYLKVSSVGDINAQSAIRKILRDRYPNSKKHNEILHQYWPSGSVPTRFLRD